MDDVPSLRAGVIIESVRLDGVLDEPEWNSADQVLNLTMIEPNEGAEPTGATHARVLASSKAIYIGIVCDDPDPSGIVSFTKQRDGNLRSEDHVRLVFDTFFDGRSGYVFQINPSGARYDALINPGGDSENSNWDGIWDAATHRDARGWSAEFWIPIQTLSFREGLEAWHFNVERRIQRLQEIDRWAGPRRDWKLTQMSRAGRLTDLPPFNLGRGLSIRPALTGGGGVPASNEDLQEPPTSALTSGSASAATCWRRSRSTRTSRSPRSIRAERTSRAFPCSFRKSGRSFSRAPTSFNSGPRSGQRCCPSSAGASASFGPRGPDSRRRQDQRARRRREPRRPCRAHARG